MTQKRLERRSPGDHGFLLVFGPNLPPIRLLGDQPKEAK